VIGDNMPYVRVKPSDYRLSVSVPRDVKVKLEKLANERGCSLSSIVREVLVKVLES